MYHLWQQEEPEHRLTLLILKTENMLPLRVSPSFFQKAAQSLRAWGWSFTCLITRSFHTIFCEICEPSRYLLPPKHVTHSWLSRPVWGQRVLHGVLHNVCVCVFCQCCLSSLRSVCEHLPSDMKCLSLYWTCLKSVSLAACCKCFRVSQELCCSMWQRYLTLASQRTADQAFSSHRAASCGIPDAQTLAS